MNGLNVIVLLKLLANEKYRWSQKELADSLGVSVSQINMALKGCAEVGLLIPKEYIPVPDRAEHFFLNAFEYVFPAKAQGDGVGLPTSHGAMPLKEHFSSSYEPFIWTFPEGKVRGKIIKPIHDKVPLISLSDETMYMFLSCLDGIRIGKSREQQLAKEWLRSEIERYGNRFR